MKTLNIGGHTDWRPPNINELDSLIDYSQYDPALPLGHPFTNVQFNAYWPWSSTTYAYGTHDAWMVYFYLGIEGYVGKSSYNYVRAVRGGQCGSLGNSVICLPKTGQTKCYDTDGNEFPCAGTGQDGEMRAGVAWPSPRFIDNGDETVTDKLTGLMWTKDANLSGHTMSWQQALDYVKTLNIGGHTDWRPPNINELDSLIDYSQYDPALPLGHPFTDVQSNAYWSSTTEASDPDYAWIVYMDYGDVYYSNKSNYYCVWCVHGGKTTHVPSNTSTTTTIQKPSPGEKVWEFVTGGSVSSSPAVSGGYVFVGSFDNMYCLNAQTGAKVWEYKTGSWVNSSPAVSRGYVYVGSGDGKLYCLNAQTGEKVWAFTSGDLVESSPAVSGGYVYVGVGGYDGKLYCLNAQTGEKVWEFITRNVINSSPAVSGGYVYVGSFDKNVYCLNAQTGEKVWAFTSGSSVHSSPAVSGGYVYVGSGDGKLYCLNAQTGEKVWAFTSGNSVDSSPAVSGEYVYVGSGDNNVYCLNAQTGAKVWEYKTGSWVNSSPAVSREYVYVGSGDNNVYCLNAQTGEKVWAFTSGHFVESSPAVSGGYVFIGSGDSKVYCLKAASGDTGSWPMFKYNPERTGAK